MAHRVQSEPSRHSFLYNIFLNPLVYDCLELDSMIIQPLVLLHGGIPFYFDGELKRGTQKINKFCYLENSAAVHRKQTPTPLNAHQQLALQQHTVRMRSHLHTHLNQFERVKRSKSAGQGKSLNCWIAHRDVMVPVSTGYSVCWHNSQRQRDKRVKASLIQANILSK